MFEVTKDDIYSMYAEAEDRRDKIIENLTKEDLKYMEEMINHPSQEYSDTEDMWNELLLCFEESFLN